MRILSTGAKVVGFVTLIVTVCLLSLNLGTAEPERCIVKPKDPCLQWRRSALQDEKGDWRWNMDTLDDLFNYLDRPLGHCFKIALTPGHIVETWNKIYMEGQKIMCQDPSFTLEPGYCRVFSFGIGMVRFGFELHMADFGCQVSIFDPEANEGPIEKMHKNFDMEPLRIGDEDKQEMRGVDSLHEWKRMSSILDTIVIINETFYVDYLKLEVKDDELDFLKDITSKRSRTLVRFKQINIKIHLGVKGTPSWADAARYYKYFVAMERKGYRLFSTTVDPLKHKRYILPGQNRIVYSHYDLVWGRCF